ncbi:alpha/beta hydrolase [Dactylosporangium sp. NPDC005572]|uniref:alpha/beta fold hydrolase n=1 Tax=Dactylosporangium sp. NPDC005572 TaxID=3156889 RepID=UPI00339F2DC2
MLQQLAYEVVGTGPVLVSVHGTSSTPAQTWGPALGQLAKSHTLVLPYLPGSGSSPLPQGPIHPVVLAEQIADVVSRAGYTRFAIAGASTGAPIAIKVASLFPDRVSHLISVCGYSSARPSLRLRLELWASLLDAGPQAVGRLLLTLGMNDRVAAMMPPEMLDEMVLAIGSNLQPGTPDQLAFAQTVDVEAELDSITTPTLVITGLRDNFIDPAHSAHIAGRIPGAELLQFDGGHGVTSDCTNAVVEAINNFIGPSRPVKESKLADS